MKKLFGLLLILTLGLTSQLKANESVVNIEIENISIDESQQFSYKIINLGDDYFNGTVKIKISTSDEIKVIDTFEVSLYDEEYYEGKYVFTETYFDSMENFNVIFEITDYKGDLVKSTQNISNLMLSPAITMRTPITTVKYPPVKASAAANSINIISSYGVEKINVYDLNGNQVVSEDASLQKEILLETSSLSKSVYIIEVVSEEKTESVKVMM